MQLLDAAIAFSLTMLVFATIVSIALEAVRNVTGLRKKELKRFLGEYYSRELQPSLQAGLLKAKNRLDEAAAQNVETLTATLVTALTTAGATKSSTGRLPKPKGSTSAEDEVETFQLAAVTTEEMIDRLKHSEVGQKIVEDLKEEAEAVFAHVASRYERFGEVFSESFRTNSRRWTFGLSLALAFFVNMDSIYLMQAYMLDGDTRAAVIQQGAGIVESAREAANQPNANGEATAQAAKESLTRLAESVDSIETLPFPVGWSQYPGCPSDSSDARCPDRAPETAAGAGSGANASTKFENLKISLTNNPAAAFTWFCGCLLTAFLAGLGTPFWYDAASNLMGLAQKARSGAGAASAGPQSPPPPGSPAAA